MDMNWKYIVSIVWLNKDSYSNLSRLSTILLLIWASFSDMWYSCILILGCIVFIWTSCLCARYQKEPQ